MFRFAVASKEDKEAVFLPNGAKTVVRHLVKGERVRLIGVDTPEVHEPKKLYRDVM